MSPSFDAKKYNALIDGLEVSEISIKSVVSITREMRLDSEYFKKEYLQVDRLTKNHSTKTLKDITSKIDVGFVGPMVMHYTDNGIKLLQTKNINEFFINDEDTIQITDSFHRQIIKSQISYEDILIARSGSFGKASIYLNKNVINSSDIVIIRADGNKINPYYLVAYLNSQSGVAQMLRFASGGLQGHVNLTILEELNVPILSVSFQLQIENIIKSANKSRSEADSLYFSCESLLFSSLGLSDFVPSQNSVTVKSLSESFGTSGRLDAEYYQQKYEELENLLHTKHTVGSLCRIYDKTFVPHKDNYKYIELADIGTSGNITGCTIAPFEELPSRARRLVKCGQVIVSSIEGSLPSCALIPNDYDGAICSTGFYVVDSSKMNPETLLILFKSNPIQALMKKRCSGTILTALTKDALEQMPLPLIDSVIQNRLSADVCRSFSLRRRSDELLEKAKRAVEIAVEDGEDTAAAFLREYAN